MTQRQAVTKKKALMYRGADRAGKSRILTELVELTGRRRDYARAALTLKIVKSRAGRAPTYGPVVTRALVKCWAVLRAPAGKRLAPMLGILVPLLRRDNELLLTDEEAAFLVRISAATIDRRLAPERAKLISRGRSHTKPGTLLKSQIPIRTWADWDDAVPGFVEIDLVGHEGGHNSGEFCFTLTVTDIATGWTVNRSVRNKAEKWVFEALMHVGRVFPFPILGIDSDNGSEFINHHLFDYCVANKITFTRSRAQRRESDQTLRHRNHSAPARYHLARDAENACYSDERRVQESPSRSPVQTDPRSHRPARNPHPGQETRGREAASQQCLERVSFAEVPS